MSSDRFPFGPVSFRPVLKASSTLLISSSSKTSSSVLDSFNKLKFLPLRVEDRVLFPDHVLLIVSNKLHHRQDLECVYYNKNDESSSFIYNTDVRPVLSIDKYGVFRFRRGIILEWWI